MSRAALVSKLGFLVGASLVLPNLFACLEHPLKPVEYDKAQEKQDNIALTVNKDVDILFIIDNSGSMGEEQGGVSANFASFINVLEAPEVAANYRIGITTTDNGNPWCSGTTPEAGALVLSTCTSRLNDFIFNGTMPPTDQQAACTDNCALMDIAITPTTTEYDATPVARKWFENIGGVTNLPAGVTTTQAFQCFGPQGINGCGFESHLESMYKALSRAQTSGEQAYGFLRETAILALIIVTDEVDCSYNNEHQTIFLADGNRVFWSDPAAAYPTSAVCWNAGVACTGAAPGPYTECHAENYDVDGNPGASDSAAVLRPVSRYVDLVQNFEDDKQSTNRSQEVIVAIIGGVPEGYVDGQDIVYQDSADTTFQNNFGIGAGCSGPAVNNVPQTAVPPVREREFAEQFEVGGDRNLYSICASDYSSALDAIAKAIAEQVRPPCMPACVQDTDATTPVLDPVCTITERIPGQPESNMPECTMMCGGSPCGPGQRGQADAWQMPNGKSACFRYLVDPGNATPSGIDQMDMECIDDGWNLEFSIERVGAAPGGTSVEATCQLSQVPEIDCPNL